MVSEAQPVKPKPSGALKRNECYRQQRYNYTPEERMERGRALADEYNALGITESELERVKKDYKSRTETHEAKIELLAEQVRSGYELRETLCFWDYNQPTEGRKTLKRADTLEAVCEEDMTAADKQLVMEEVDAVAAVASAAANANALGLPAPKPEKQAEPDTTTTPKGPKKSDKPRRTSRGGVVACDADGEDLGDDDDNNNGRD